MVTNEERKWQILSGFRPSSKRSIKEPSKKPNPWAQRGSQREWVFNSPQRSKPKASRPRKAAHVGGLAYMCRHTCVQEREPKHRGNSHAWGSSSLIHSPITSEKKKTTKINIEKCPIASDACKKRNPQGRNHHVVWRLPPIQGVLLARISSCFHHIFLVF